MSEQVSLAPSAMNFATITVMVIVILTALVVIGQVGGRMLRSKARPANTSQEYSVA